MLQSMVPEISLSLFGLTFVEGFLAFLSPCILPMIPIYLLYLGGQEGGEKNKGMRLIINTLGFVAGFSLVFITLGATASALGALISQHRVLLQRLGGLFVIAFGLNYLGVLKIGFLNRSRSLGANTKDLKFWSSLLFGAAFSLGWTPCLGAFLGTALIMASNFDTLYQGMALLLVFSLGLGVPFLLTALLWSRLQNALGFIKRNMGIIQTISGILLIVVGLLMLLDLFGSYATIFL